MTRRSGLQLKYLWKACCREQAPFNRVTNVTCFGPEGRQGWEARLCCSALQQPQNLTLHLWKRVLEAPPSRPPSGNTSANVSTACVAVAYHKTGATLLYNLVKDPRSALSRYLLGQQTESLGWLRPWSTEAFPSLEGSRFSIWSPTSQRDLTLFVAPPEISHPVILNNVLKSRSGRVVHMVRKPSEIIASAYLYHLRCDEKWFELDDPPGCDFCDDAAWKSIFSACKFKCSYQALLQQSDLKHGIEAELQRSRWQILKMIFNMKNWQSEDVLTVSLSHFSSDFDATVRCIVSFWLHGLHDLQPLDVETTIEDILAEARLHGNFALDVRKARNNTKAPQVKTVRAYVKKFLRQQEHRFLQEADVQYEQMMMQSQRASSAFGCPDRSRKTTIP
eukprot:Skav233640  [mRNA]  locus=scaffold2779:320371:321543:+ [translate_table: standard]